MEGLNNINNQAEIPKKKFFEVVKDSAKIMALLTAFSLPAQEVQGSNTNEDKGKENISFSIEANKEALKKIKTKLIELTKETENRLGDTEILDYQSGEGRVVMPKHNDKYTIVMDNSGKLGFFDKNSDGEVDGVVLNNKTESPDKILLQSLRYFMVQVDELMEEASVIKGTEMEKDVQIVRFDKEKKETKCLDMKKVEGNTISWEDSLRLFEDGQKMYSEKLHKISEEIK